MKKKIIMETLVAAAFAVSAQVQAAPISLSNANITATFNGNANQIGHYSQDYTAGANTGGLDPNGAYVEFASAGNLFNFDFDSSGLLYAYAALPLDSNGIAQLPNVGGSYKVRFDFGTSLAAAIGGFTLADGGADGLLGGTPVLSVIDSHTIELDLSNLVWNDQFIPLTAQISAVDANVPEPASLGLLLAGAAGFAATRRRRAA